jgi:hypothetical protein
LSADPRELLSPIFRNNVDLRIENCAKRPGPGSAPGSGASLADATATPSLQRGHASFGRFSTWT